MADVQPGEITEMDRPAGLRAIDGPLGYDGGLYRRLTHFASCWIFGLPAWALLRLLWTVEVVGKERLAGLRPPFLMVSNHQSLIDSHVVCLAFGLWPRGLFDPHIVPLHTPEAGNFMASRTARFIHTALRCIPFSRGKGLHQPAMDTVIGLLTAPRRNVVYMFPEGTRSRDDAIGRAQPGVGRVVLSARCRVLPIHLSGLSEILPIGARRPRPGGRIRIHIGETVAPERWKDLSNERAHWQQVSQDLLDAVTALAPSTASAPEGPPSTPGSAGPG